MIISIIAYINGLSHLDYDVNLKPLVLTIVLIFLEGRKLPMLLLKRFIYLITFILFIEYSIAYSQIYPYIFLDRHGLIRPLGVFFGVHDISYVLVFGYFAIGYTKFSGFLSLLLGSYQTALAWFLLVYKKLNKFIFVVFLISMLFLLISIGHLNFEQKNSMIYIAINTLLNAPVDYSCLILGCSNNISSLYAGQLGQFYDFGIYRVLYQFGFIWILLMVYVLRKYDKSVLLANFVLWIHYPVNLGVVGFLFFIWVLKYIEYTKNLTPEIDKFNNKSFFSLLVVKIKHIRN